MPISTEQRSQAIRSVSNSPALDTLHHNLDLGFDIEMPDGSKKALDINPVDVDRPNVRFDRIWNEKYNPNDMEAWRQSQFGYLLVMDAAAPGPSYGSWNGTTPDEMKSPAQLAFSEIIGELPIGTSDLDGVSGAELIAASDPRNTRQILSFMAMGALQDEWTIDAKWARNGSLYEMPGERIQIQQVAALADYMVNNAVLRVH